jgi:chromatin segregation and condensation protein Rec8/ScpA/Scc1 (kleisin family)
MLELVREGIIDVMQNAKFDDIEIKKQERKVWN